MKFGGVIQMAAAVAFGLVLPACPAMCDEIPQATDTGHLAKLKDWPTKSPYTGNKEAIDIGASGYNQNCARCHGLEMISGGIAPDLRKVPPDQDGDDLFTQRMHEGAKRNDITVMPKFYSLLPNEELWAIRAFMISKNIPE